MFLFEDGEPETFHEISSFIKTVHLGWKWCLALALFARGSCLFPQRRHTSTTVALEWEFCWRIYYGFFACPCLFSCKCLIREYGCWKFVIITSYLLFMSFKSTFEIRFIRIFTQCFPKGLISHYFSTVCLLLSNKKIMTGWCLALRNGFIKTCM